MTSHQGPSLFEQIRKPDDNGNEFWSARDLAKVLEYTEYRHFKPAVERDVSDYFEDMLEMVELGGGGKRAVEAPQIT